MAARDLSAWLASAALEGPTGPEAVDAGARVARVIALGASLEDLDPDAAHGVAFLIRRIRAEFTIPALASASSEAFIELWAQVSIRALRLMDAVSVCVFEASGAASSGLMTQRLEHGDKVVCAQLERALVARGASDLGDRLRRTVALVGEARERLRELVNQGGEVDDDLVRSFHQGSLMWALGIGLCAEITERMSSFVGEALRPGLMTDAVDFTSEGARLTACFAAMSAELHIRWQATPEELRPLLSNDEALLVLLRATREVPRLFGPDVVYALELFRYPDEPGATEFHLVIDSKLPPEQACERLDEFCDGCWDAAAGSLGIDFFPILGVIDGD